MMNVKSTVSSILFGLALVLIGPLQGIAATAETEAGKAFFLQRCQVCHNPHSKATTYGPSLIGVVGRKAGTVQGFAYSEAVRNSGIVWTDEALKAWMADNDHFLPGTRMRHVGVEDAAERDMILEYLKSLK